MDQKTILFIEDEETLQKVVGEALAQEGFKIISAFDGEKGLELARSENPSLILLDLVMPRMGGFEVLQGLKADPATAKIPVIVLTNLENSADIERAISAGATTYLVKANYKLDELVSKVKEAINRA